MELSDRLLMSNLDWDPGYLKEIFDSDFNDCTDLWFSDITDMDIVKEVDKYSPIVEDISLDDDMFCRAVEKIESE